MDTTSESFATSVGLLRNILTRNIAIDCEMMHANIGQVLGRVSIVNHEGQTVFDTFLCYPESIEITNTNQVYSGIDWDNINQKNGTQPFSEVQTQLVELLHDRTVIGHNIKKDLRAILIDVPACASKLQDITRFATPIAFNVTVRDTQKYSGY
jgi:RNA exonuclease 4